MTAKKRNSRDPGEESPEEAIVVCIEGFWQCQALPGTLEALFIKKTLMKTCFCMFSLPETNEKVPYGALERLMGP